MKWITIILFFISSTVFAEYDSTYVLTVRQNACIPENCSNGDEVIRWRKTYTWLSGNTITYAIETNFYDAFTITKINNDSARVTITDATHINGKVVQQDTIINLIIRTTDAVLGYELDTLKIRVKENSYCRFIDYSYEGTESGTRTQPYNDRSDFTVVAGYGYFFKRGTTKLQGQKTVTACVATATNPTVIGAYGTGKNPVTDHTGITSPIWDFGTNHDCADSVAYLEMYDQILSNSPYSALSGEQESCCNRMWFYNLNILNCASSDNLIAYEAAVTFQTTYTDTAKYRPFYFRNVEWNTVSGNSGSNGAMKIGAGPNQVVNCRVTGVAAGDGLRFTQGKHSSCKHVYFDDMGTAPGAAAIQIRGDYMTVEDCYIDGQNGKSGITIAASPDPFVPIGCTIKNTMIKNTVYLVYIDGGSGTMNGNLFEDNYFKNNETCEIYNNTNMVWRYNKFENSCMQFNASSNNTIYFYYNIGFGTNLICSAGTGFAILNNTWEGAINGTGAANVTIRNNYAASFAGNILSNNIDIDTIDTDLHFTDYAGHDYHLLSTATGAIDQGVYWGQVSDHDGKVKRSSQFDIGAYEYLPKIPKRNGVPIQFKRKGQLKHME